MATTDAALSVEQIRACEAAAMRTTTEQVLMDRAAAAVAQAVRDGLAARGEQVPGARLTLLVGSGLNGGDALLAGALLAREGASVVAIPASPSIHERGSQMLIEAGGRVEPDPAGSAVDSSDVVIDGIVGIGGRAGLREPAAALVSQIPSCALVVAVDLPSGLAADDASDAAPHVHADVTVTFTAPKPCLIDQPAAASAGRVIVADVGIPVDPGLVPGD